jgi:hypothetical protein
MAKKEIKPVHEVQCPDCQDYKIEAVTDGTGCAVLFYECWHCGRRYSIRQFRKMAAL